MMKLHVRIFSALLAIAIFMAVAGFSIYEHYCGKNLVSKSLYTSSEKCHPVASEMTCTSSAKDDCCRDHFEFIHLDIELKNPDTQSSNEDFIPKIAVTSYFSSLETPALAEVRSFQKNHIPLCKEKPFYLLHQQLIFYG